MAERISAVLTDEMRLAILKFKNTKTPDTEKIMGVEYYQAVIQDGVRSYPEFEEWRRLHPVVGVVGMDASQIGSLCGEKDCMY